MRMQNTRAPGNIRGDLRLSCYITGPDVPRRPSMGPYSRPLITLLAPPPLIALLLRLGVAPDRLELGQGSRVARALLVRLHAPCADGRLARRSGLDLSPPRIGLPRL